jgi:diadenosine tetraphosphatase ApaH/serine/threonine PP2A family protein phosphatase
VIALISDIHSNIEALTAVLEDIASRDIDKVYCLGDVIGYGPNPRECLKLAREFDICLMGNHEYAVLYGAENFNPRAAKAIEWTRAQLFTKDEEGQKNLTFLKSLKQTYTEGDLTMVHASPRQPIKEYILPSDVRNPAKLDANFALFDRVCVTGHTHHPGVFLPGYVFEKPADIMNIYLLDPHERALLNVGSVGQSRDGNNAACYATFDGEAIVFRRVAYDFMATMKKIRNIPLLDNSLADRLAAGR